MTRTSLTESTMARSKSGGMVFDDYHRIGETVAPQLETHCSYREIGEQLGITKQRAWHIGMVALGKLAYQLREQYKD